MSGTAVLFCDLRGARGTRARQATILHGTMFASLWPSDYQSLCPISGCLCVLATLDIEGRQKKGGLLAQFCIDMFTCNLSICQKANMEE